MFLVLALVFFVIAIVIWATLIQEAPKIVKAFDIVRNIKHFNIRENEDLNILDGVRAVSMVWIVFYHTFIYDFTTGQANIKTIHHRLVNPFFLLAEEGTIIVDLFFMLSGFLLAYVSLKK